MPTTTPRILQELLGDPPVQSTACEQMEVADLLAYIEAELDGRNAVLLYPQVWMTLENSLACRQEYLEVRELLRLERAGLWQEPPRAAQIDFSYLTKLTAVEDPPFWSFDASGRLYIFFPAERLQAVRSGKPQEEYALLRAEEGPTILFFDKIVSGKDLDVALTVRTAAEQAEVCTLVINADIPSRGGWPNLADTLVTVRHQQELWQEQLTDEFGAVLFDGFPVKNLAELTIVVEPGPSRQV